MKGYQGLMKKSGILFCLLLSIFLAGCSGASKEERNARIQDIIEDISIARLKEDVRELVAFGTRYPHKKQLEAAEYLHKRLGEDLGRVYFHEYEYWGVIWKNVVGEVRGKHDPEKVLIVCAHLDSKSEERLAFAPGADDNASGCAAVLELARVFSGHSFEKTVRFVLFSRESDGQNGSNAYVESMDRSKEEIAAVLNLDMIAYGSDEEEIDLFTRPEDSWLADKIYGLAGAYGLPARKVVKEACY